MRIKKRGMGLLLVVFVVLLMLFLNGCEGEDVPTTIQTPYVGGTSGLEFAFQDDEPPGNVLDNGQQEFYITLLLKNLGEHSIPAGGVVASLSGIDKDAFSLPSLTVKNDIEIEGVVKDQEFVIEGAQEILEFTEAKYINDVPADFSIILRADICYAYETNAISNLCLKKNILEKTIEDVCEINVPDLAVYNSGAPVQITNVRQSSVGSSKVKLVFSVSNVGTGIVYLPGTFSNACSGKEVNKDKLFVALTNPQNNFNVECSGFGGSSSGEVRLVNNKKEISCTIDTVGLQGVTYQDLLKFEVDYVYREAITTPLVVENAV